MLVCITRSAASDRVMEFLEEHVGRRPCLLLTANAGSDRVRQMIDEQGLMVAPLGLAVSRPAVATQSIPAIIMMLDCSLASDSSERLKLWRDFARDMRTDMEWFMQRAGRRAAIPALADRLFVIGDETMGAVAHSLILTIMEVTDMLSVAIPLHAGSRGPAVQLGAGDCAILLGQGPEQMFRRYRQGTGYSLHLNPPSDRSELTQALYALIEGQMLALRLSALR
jgi:hypothetical protein